MSKTSSEPPENWQRVLAAAKASRPDPGDAAPSEEVPLPPEELSSNIIHRLRAFNSSLALWQRCSLLAGLVSILLFIASIIYLKTSGRNYHAPIIETPALELPTPAPINDSP